MHPETVFLDVPILGGTEGTHRLAVHCWGETSAKETVICVHGLTRNGRDFDVLAEYLSADYRVLSIDIAGRGKSQWHTNPAHYSYPDYVSDIGFVLKHFAITRAHWVGTSMGGIIGMMVANSFPNVLQTLTLNDIGCLVPASGFARILQYVGVVPVYDTRAQAEAELRRRCAPYGITSEAHWQNLFAHSIEENGDGPESKPWRLAYDPAIMHALPPADKMVDIPLWGLWEAIQPIPTLLIRGTESDLLSHETALQMQSTHPNFTLLEIDGVGHAPALMDEVQISAIKKRLLAA